MISNPNKIEKLVILILKYPGCNALELKERGYRPQTHGSLRDAEYDGILRYTNAGWYVIHSQIPPAK